MIPTSLFLDNMEAAVTGEKISYEGRHYLLSDIIKGFEESITPERIARIRSVVQQRSRHVVTVLEDLYDRGNASAVMRTSEAMGFLDVHVIEKSDKFKKANRVTKGADKWLNVHKWKETPQCMLQLKSQGYKIFATSLDQAISFDDVPWQEPFALVFENENEGISKEVLEHCDQTIKIPMYGFVQSFNISVAAALALYRARHEIKERQLDPFLKGRELYRLYGDYLLRAHLNPEALLSRMPKFS